MFTLGGAASRIALDDLSLAPCSNFTRAGATLVMQPAGNPSAAHPTETYTRHSPSWNHCSTVVKLRRPYFRAPDAAAPCDSVPHTSVLDSQSASHQTPKNDPYTPLESSE